MTLTPFARPVSIAAYRTAPTMPSLERLTHIYATNVYDYWMAASNGDPGVSTGEEEVRAGLAAVVDAVLDAQVAIAEHSKAIVDDADATLDSTLILYDDEDYEQTTDWLHYLKGSVE